MFTILIQSQNFSFYEKTLEYQNKINEYIISLTKKKKKLDRKFYDNIFLNNKNEWQLKCKLKNMEYDLSKLTKFNFHVEIPEIHKKRTCQQKIVEEMVLKLFTKQSIFSLIDMLFKDMNEDAKIFDKKDSSDEEEEEEEIN